MPLTQGRAALEAAFAQGQIVHVFQPIWDLRGRRVESVEALVRWDHPTAGLLGPGEFLGAIAEFGLAEELTRCTLADAVDALPRLRAHFGPEVAVAVNLSSAQLRNFDATTAAFHDALGRPGVDPSNLVVEVVEDLSRTQVPMGAPTVEALRRLGVRVVLDDFGTGAGTLSLLTDLGYDGLKIDRHFVTRITSPGPARSVVEAIISFAENAGIQVVAEGIEDNFTLEELSRMRCHHAQGYLLGRPMPLDDLFDAIGSAVDPHSFTDSFTDTVGWSAAGQPIGDVSADDLMARIEDELDFNTPRSIDTVEKVSIELERLAERLPDPYREQLLLEIAWRKLHAAIFTGNGTAGIGWGMEASRLAESLGQTGRSGWMLSMVSLLMPLSSSDRVLTSQALARTLAIRANTPLTDEERATIDNNLGSVLANLGLLEEALRWWRQAVELPTTADCRGFALACLNLANVELGRLEGEPSDLRPIPRVLSQERIELALTGLDRSAFAGDELYQATAARMALLLGDTHAAELHLDGVTGEDTFGVLSLYSVTRSRALLAKARGETDLFLRHAEDLLDLLDVNSVVRLYRLRAERLYADALAATGRHDDAYIFLDEITRLDSINAAAHLHGFFEWMRIGVNVDQQFGEFYGGQGPGSGPTSD